MSAWQSTHRVPTLLNTGLVWHSTQATLLCKPSSGYRVRLWSNSGTARIGFQPLNVWQFWQVILSWPCGLRVVGSLAPCCSLALLEAWGGRGVAKARAKPTASSIMVHPAARLETNFTPLAVESDFLP